MNKATIIVVLMALINISFAGNDKEEKISLDNHKVEIQNCGFKLEEVINATGYTNKVGSIRKGMDYHKVIVYFKANIADELNSFVTKNLEKVDPIHNLILRVNKVNVSETFDGMNETTVAKVNLTFIYKEGDRYFEKFTCEMNDIKTSNFNSTEKLTKLLAAQIAACFEQFKERTIQGKLSSTEILPENIADISDQENRITTEIVSAQRIKKGIYKTYSDFRYNTPDSIPEFDVEYKTKSTSDESILIKYAQIEDKQTKKKIEEIWGFTDGSAIYILVGNKYLPLLNDEEGYYIELKVQDSETMLWAGMLGGLVGSAIAYASTPVSKVRLNCNSGKFDIFDQLMGGHPDNAPENYTRVYSSSFNDKNSSFEIFINNELKCKLQKDTWYENVLENELESFVLKVRSASGKEVEITVIPKTKTKDIFICSENRKGELKVSLVPSNRIIGASSKMTSDNKVNGSSLN
jgi:hypothetical protein